MCVLYFYHLSSLPLSSFDGLLQQVTHSSHVSSHLPAIYSFLFVNILLLPVMFLFLLSSFLILSPSPHPPKCPCSFLVWINVCVWRLLSAVCFVYIFDHGTPCFCSTGRLWRPICVPAGRHQCLGSPRHCEFWPIWLHPGQEAISVHPHVGLLPLGGGQHEESHLRENQQAQ